MKKKVLFAAAICTAICGVNSASGANLDVYANGGAQPTVASAQAPQYYASAPVYSNYSSQYLPGTTYGATTYAPSFVESTYSENYAGALNSNASQFKSGAASSKKYVYSPYESYYGQETAEEVDGAIVPSTAEPTKWISGSMVGSWYDGFLRKGNSRSTNLNQIWLTAEKKVDTSVKRADFGGRIDALFGTTNMQCADGGFDGKWGVSDDGYAASIYQAYAEIGVGKLSAKVGKFGTILGYEPVDNVPCTLNTHTYMYGHEPATHCGVLFNFAPGDVLSFDFGLTSGADNSFENDFGDTGFLFGATFTPAENFSLSYASGLNQVHAANFGSFSWGYYDLGGRFVGDKNEYLQTVVASADLTDQISIAAATNYGTMEDRAQKIERYRQIGAAGYLTYKFAPTLDGTIRYEYYVQKLMLEAIEARYHDVGFALYYRPTDHVFLRPDVRYDWVDEGQKDDGVTGAVAFGVTF